MATITRTGKKDYILQDTDIVMCKTGNDIGSIYEDKERIDKSTKPSCFIISSSQKDLTDKLKAKKSDIKALVKGSAMLQINIKDLLELDI